MPGFYPENSEGNYEVSPEEALKIYESGSGPVVKTLCGLCDTIDSLQQEVSVLRKELARLSKNSSNSGKPPSSDDITKPKRKKKGKGKRRKIGGQPGHELHERPPFPVEEISNFYDYILPECPICGSQVRIFDAPPRIIQQMELPVEPIIKDEHRSYPVWCENCQMVHYMPFPVEVMKGGLFNVRLTSLVGYMKNVCHASFSTIRKFIRDVLGEKVSRGYLRKVIEKVGRSLEGPYIELLERLPLEKKINVDETGHKENGEKFWTWVFKAELYVLFKIDKSRGSKVLADVLGQEFNGTLGCDYFSAYRKYMRDFNVTVQFCLAHLIRDIRFLMTLPDKETKDYGATLLKEIRELFRIIHEKDEMSPEDFTVSLEASRDRIILTALNAPSRLNKDGKEEKREAQNMSERFRKHGRSYFEFITTPGIDPTNNVAEQAIRFVVIDRHVTQGTRSPKGRKTSEVLWSVIATCALQGRSAFNFILEAVEAYFKGEPTPSLLPDTS